MSESHRRHHWQGPVGQFLRQYGFEIVWLIVIAIGVFLVLERMFIRSTLMRWVQTGIAGFLHSVGHVDKALLDFAKQTTLSDTIGAVLILGALVAILLRIRWRLLRTSAPTAIRCPRCGGVIHRVHRRPGDRLASWFVPVRRYRCADRECRWSGLRIAAGPDRGQSDEAPPLVTQL